MNRWVVVAHLDDLPENQPMPFELDDEALVLVRQGERVYAFQDLCSHMEYPLHDGHIEGNVITCAYHGAKFDLETGDVLALPAFEPIRTYPVRIQDGQVYVNLTEE